MDVIKTLAGELQIREGQVQAAVKLIDEGNTIPFIARYRKEATGSLNDEVLRNLDERLKYLRNLEDRKEQVIASIGEQEKLTEEAGKEDPGGENPGGCGGSLSAIPPQEKNESRIAREKGLMPLADQIFLQEMSVPAIEEAEGFVSEEKGVATAKEALDGAMDILAERISDHPGYRTWIRNITMNKGLLQSSAKDEKVKSVYETYYNYEEPVKKGCGP